MIQLCYTKYILMMTGNKKYILMKTGKTGLKPVTENDRTL
jgi:hypothetical protein